MYGMASCSGTASHTTHVKKSRPIAKALESDMHYVKDGKLIWSSIRIDPETSQIEAYNWNRAMLTPYRARPVLLQERKSAQRFVSNDHQHSVRTVNTANGISHGKR